MTLKRITFTLLKGLEIGLFFFLHTLFRIHYKFSDFCSPFDIFLGIA